MNNHIKSFLVLFLIANTIVVSGQPKYNLPPRNNYQKATISLMNLQKKDVESLSIVNDSIHYIENGRSFSLHLEEVNYIRVAEGTKAAGGALIGGVSTLLIFLSAILEVESDPDYELKDNAGVTVALFTVGGTAIGALIGAAIPKKTSYYVHLQTAAQSE
jgi:hypothetical protein